MKYALAITALCAVLGLSVASHATPVFINELHYDNTGTDTGEALEIAGPAGTDLTGWSLVLYNGSSGALYNTVLLSGIIPDLGSGFGVVSSAYPTNGVQNGSPDGVALVDNSSAVIQFLSYEGAFAAVNGPANGITSTDIGVSENFSTLVGNSLQLGGTGSMYEDFSWNPDAPNTFGAFNTSQTFLDTLQPGALVINEIMQNPSAVSDSDGEWFELFNPIDIDVDIDGWTIADNGTNTHTINNGGPLIITVGGFLVLGNNANSTTNGGVSVDYQYTNFFIANVDDEIVLLDKTLMEIDRVEYDNGATFPDPNGASMALVDPGLDNNLGANWATSTSAFGTGDLGTPGRCNVDVGENCTIAAPEPATPAPEPTTTTLLTLGLLGVGYSRRRRKRS